MYKEKHYSPTNPHMFTSQAHLWSVKLNTGQRVESKQRMGVSTSKGQAFRMPLAIHEDFSQLLSIRYHSQPPLASKHK